MPRMRRICAILICVASSSTEMVITSGWDPELIFRLLEHSSQNSVVGPPKRAVQFSALAIIKARVCLPSPSGPEKINPWGNRPSCSFRTSRSTAFGLPTKLAKPINRTQATSGYDDEQFQLDG